MRLFCLSVSNVTLCTPQGPILQEKKLLVIYIQYLRCRIGDYQLHSDAILKFA